MRYHRLFVPLAVLVLASGVGEARKPAFTPSIGQSADYRCADGRRIEVLYAGGEVAVVTIGDTPVQMARAADDAGELYAGGGWRWRTTAARAGTLDRDGVGTSCRAQ